MSAPYLVLPADAIDAPDMLDAADSYPTLEAALMGARRTFAENAAAGDMKVYALRFVCDVKRTACGAEPADDVAFG